MKSIIQNSLKSCLENKLDQNTKRALIYANRNEFLNIKKQNKSLHEAFNDSCSSFISKLTDDIVIMLTDSKGTLISSIGNSSILSKLSCAGIDNGVSFSELSLGTNAISLAMETRASIFLEPKDHYLNILKNWHCFATPLVFENEIIGYLDISTLNVDMKNEIKVIAELLPYKIILNMYDLKKMDEVSNKSQKVKVSTRQLEIMSLLITGFTEKQIATTLFIALPTVKYHKSKIFEKLDVKNTKQLVKKYYEIENQLCS